MLKQIDRVVKDSLVQNNVLSLSEADTYQHEAASTNTTLKDFLLSNSIITPQQLLIALSQASGLERIDLRNYDINPSVTEKVPIKFAWYYKIMPILVEEGILTVASSIPLPVKVQDEIRMHLGYSLKNVLASENDVLDSLQKYYGFASDTIDKIMTKSPVTGSLEKAGKTDWVEDIEQRSDDPTVSQLVNEILLEAYKKRATDIHIEPYRDKVRFRYRIDGVLIDANLPDRVKHFLPSILSRIKILANLSITERRLPQDGSAVVRTKDQQLDLRVSTMPTPRGESMVIRILPSKVMLFSLEKLGFDQRSVDSFKQLLQKPHGIIFMTGPTGSGKTTSLYACLNEINSSVKKIITIEDPVEYEMEGVTQVQVNPKVDFTFATGLRSMLRHDPDIIMVGEVRDLETAEIAIRTALTGHLVFSTLHTNDAASGVTRLVDMGVEPYLVASSVEAFVAQRLVRLICPKCKCKDERTLTAIKKEMAEYFDIKDASNISIYKGKGCDHCNQTGYFGRVAVYEILMMNDAIRSAILDKPRSDYIKQIAIKEGLITLRENGWKAVFDGLTTPDEILNVTVKDEHHDLDNKTDEKLQPPHVEQKKDETKKISMKDKNALSANNEYEGRIYPRLYKPIELCYSLVKRSEDNINFLESDGVEHTTLTEDISAGGVRFVSKELLVIGSILELKVRLGIELPNIKCLAKICRVEEDSIRNVYTVVAYFLDISSAERSILNRFVLEKNLLDQKLKVQ